MKNLKKAKEVYQSIHIPKHLSYVVNKAIGKNGKKVEIKNQEQVNEILKQIENEKFIVKNVKKSEKKRNPVPPFTTSTMQQEASRKLGFTLKKTMSVAQGLYEGVKIEERGLTRTYNIYENRLYKNI